MIDFIIVGLIIALVFFAVKRLIKSSKSNGCAGCSGCSAGNIKNCKKL